MSVEAIALEASGLTKRYGGRTAVDGIDLRVGPGESVALLGPNGSGKTTLLRMLAGVARPDAGTVSSGGTRVGWVPHQPSLYARMSVRENLAFFAGLEGAADPAGLASELIERADLSRYADDLAAGLSTGTTQRLNLAIALSGRPEVLLLDEPTATLSPDQRSRLWEWLRRLRDDDAMALVFATHDLDEVVRHATRLLVIANGKVLFAGPPAELGTDAGEAEVALLRLIGASAT